MYPRKLLDVDSSFFFFLFQKKCIEQRWRPSWCCCVVGTRSEEGFFRVASGLRKNRSDEGLKGGDSNGGRQKKKKKWASARVRARPPTRRARGRAGSSGGGGLGGRDGWAWAWRAGGGALGIPRARRARAGRRAVAAGSRVRRACARECAGADAGARGGRRACGGARRKEKC